MELHKSLVQDLILDGWLDPDRAEKVLKDQYEKGWYDGWCCGKKQANEEIAKLRRIVDRARKENPYLMWALQSEEAWNEYALAAQEERNYLFRVVTTTGMKICPECGRPLYGCRCEHCNGDGYSFEGG